MYDCVGINRGTHVSGSRVALGSDIAVVCVMGITHETLGEFWVVVFLHECSFSHWVLVFWTLALCGLF